MVTRWRRRHTRLRRGPLPPSTRYSSNNSDRIPSTPAIHPLRTTVFWSVTDRRNAVVVVRVTDFQSQPAQWTQRAGEERRVASRDEHFFFFEGGGKLKIDSVRTLYVPLTGARSSPHANTATETVVVVCGSPRSTRIRSPSGRFDVAVGTVGRAGFCSSARPLAPIRFAAVILSYHENVGMIL